jgi:hypothetical protein
MAVPGTATTIRAVEAAAAARRIKLLKDLEGAT